MDSSLAFELVSLDAIGQAELVAAGEVAATLDTSGRLRTGEAGPLAGVPFLLKDLGASLAGTPEAMGSRALRKHVATESACTTEPSLFGPTVNPWSPSITPDGHRSRM